jgi:hypothetical protein
MFKVVFMDELGNSRVAIVTGANDVMEAAYSFNAKHPAAQINEVTPIVGVEHITAQAA